MIDDKALADTVWGRFKDYVPDNLRGIKPVPYMSSVTMGDEYTPIGVHPRFRFYKYDPITDYILKHDDYRNSRYRYDPDTDTYYLQMTFFTPLIYLNGKFEDGETCFWTKYSTPEQEGASHCRFLRETEFAPHDLAIKPKTGMGLLQDHMVQHEGKPCRKGTKYIVRTDILHETEIPKGRAEDSLKKGQIYSDWTRHYEPSCPNYTE